MPRIAGDRPQYQFRLCRVNDKGIATPTVHGFDLVSVSTFIGDVMGKPAGAMSWWGFRIGLLGIAEAIQAGESLDGLDAEVLEALLKERGVNPNMKLSEAGDRGNAAHRILELLSTLEPDDRKIALTLAEDETNSNGTKYGAAVIDWWDEAVKPHLESQAITQVMAEFPVWSLQHGYSGTFDLALEWEGLGWEILDLKTHKPARGFTLPGKGCGFISDVCQIRAYRMAFEEMGLGETLRQRVVVAREKGEYLEDYREVPESLVVGLRRAYDWKQQFEKGAVDG